MQAALSARALFRALHSKPLTTRSYASQHGQPEKETSAEDEQAQAPEALEGQPSQEAYVAEIIVPWMEPTLSALLHARLIEGPGFGKMVEPTHFGTRLTICQ